MPRQSISLSPPNDEWLKDQVDGEEFASKSEAINALIRKARETENLREHLIKAEQGGFFDPKPDEILDEFKQTAKARGLL